MGFFEKSMVLVFTNSIDFFGISIGFLTNSMETPKDLKNSVSPGFPEEIHVSA